MTDEALRAIAAALAGEAVDVPIPIRGGGNNRLYRVAGASAVYALKRYPDDPVEARGRYGREYGGLRFLWKHGVRCIPEPIGLAQEAGVALYRWIDAPPAGAVGLADLDALADFCRRLHGLRSAEGAGALPAAREAVFSAAELHRQIAARLARLEGSAAEHADLAALVRDIGAEAARRRPAVASENPLPLAARTLSPSDFGLHNALRSPGGLVFVDFEYFGWDDPVKLVADVLWHPGMALGESERQRFFGRVADAYKVDADFSARFERDAALYGLRWTLIVLNEFLPEVWQRRLAAGGEADRAAALGRQLFKARALLDRVRRNAVLA